MQGIIPDRAAPVMPDAVLYATPPATQQERAQLRAAMAGADRVATTRIISAALLRQVEP